MYRSGRSDIDYRAATRYSDHGPAQFLPYRQGNEGGSTYKHCSFQSFEQFQVARHTARITSPIDHGEATGANKGTTSAYSFNKRNIV